MSSKNESQKNTPHVPVMLNEIDEYLSPCLGSENPLYFDGTFGRGGHFKFLISKFPKITTIAFDQDLEAVEFAQNNFQELIKLNKFSIFHKNFSQFQSNEVGLFDAMLLDLGVSSPQLDQSHRGFSFYHEGPLDMRMNQTESLTAAQIIAEYDEDELNHLFQEYGEIQKPYRVVKAIVEHYASHSILSLYSK